MKEILDCAFCDGTAHLMKEPRAITYRKREHGIIFYFYKCGKCQEQFTTTESDGISLSPVYDNKRNRRVIWIGFALEIIGSAMLCNYFDSWIPSTAIFGILLGDYLVNISKI